MSESGTEGRLEGSLFMDVWAQSLRKVISRSTALTPVSTLSLWLIRLFKRTNQEPGEDVNYPTVMQIEYSHRPAAPVSAQTRAQRLTYIWFLMSIHIQITMWKQTFEAEDKKKENRCLNIFLNQYISKSTGFTLVFPACTQNKQQCPDLNNTHNEPDIL